jgi:hypothetical protein
MADTKTLSATPLTLSALAFGIALGGGGVYMLGEDEQLHPVQVQQDRAPSEMDAILTFAPKNCADEMAQIPDYDKGLACAIGESYLGSDKEPSAVLICNGAVMPRRLQACIEEAAAAQARKESDEKIKTG